MYKSYKGYSIILFCLIDFGVETVIHLTAKMMKLKWFFII